MDEIVFAAALMILIFYTCVLTSMYVTVDIESFWTEGYAPPITYQKIPRFHATVGFWCQIIYKKFLRRFDTIFGLKMMMKSGLEKNILKFHDGLQSCCCPVQKNLPRKAELAWQVSRYL